MENSATETVKDGKTEEMRTQMLIKMIRREAHLKHIVEQSAFGFFIGDTTISRILRIIGLILLLGGVTLYLFSDAFSYSGVWPLIAIAAFVEALRANRRMDAMLELELIAEQIYPDKTDSC
jgi:hypothetical protein